MADLAAIEKQMQDLIAPSYQTQQQALADQFNNQLNQLQQQKTAIPAQYDPQRAAADLRAANAQNSMADYLSNIGYGTGSGLGASKLVDIANQRNQAFNTIGQAQNTALQGAQNNIDTAQTTFNTNSANLSAQEQKDIASAAQTEYQNEQQREYQAQQAELARQQAELARQQQEKLQQEQLAAQAEEAQKQRDFQASQAAADRAASSSASTASALVAAQKAQAEQDAKDIQNGVAYAMKTYYYPVYGKSATGQNYISRYTPNTSKNAIIKEITGNYNPSVAASILSMLPTDINLYKGNSVQRVYNLADYYAYSKNGWSGNAPKK